MAKMYPSGLKKRDFRLLQKKKLYSWSSREHEVYEKLERCLGDDYHVFYSYHLEGVHTGSHVPKGEKRDRRECDFVIYREGKGILCLEVKASEFRCQGENWEQKNRKEEVWIELGESPYEQVRSYEEMLYKHYIRPLVEDERKDKRNRRLNCHVGYAVWFLDMKKDDMPDSPNYPKKYTLYQDAFDGSKDEDEKNNRVLSEASSSDEEINLAKAIDGLFESAVIEAHGASNTDDLNGSILECLEGLFNITRVRTIENKHRDQEYEFKQLYEDQARVLDFLRFERKAAIWGIGGSGKTLIAMKKARDLAGLGEGRVLFMCFNTRLKDVLESNLDDCPYVDVFQFSGLRDRFGCEKLDGLSKRLLSLYAEDMFPYKHLVVDEFQDLGEEPYNTIISTLIEIINACDGSTFVFYDDCQIAFRDQMPDALGEFRCQLALYAMCRNTKQIASTALASIGTKDVDYRCSYDGNKPIIMRVPRYANGEDLKKTLSQAVGQLNKVRACNTKDIQIVTCLSRREFASKYNLDPKTKTIDAGKNKIRWSTVREFKGLEAKGIVLTDVTKGVWLSNDVGGEGKSGNDGMAEGGEAPGTLFYIGASRAMHELCVICDVDDEDCKAIVGCIKELERNKKRIARAVDSGESSDTNSEENRSAFEHLADVLGCEVYKFKI